MAKDKKKKKVPYISADENTAFAACALMSIMSKKDVVKKIKRSTKIDIQIGDEDDGEY